LRCWAVSKGQEWGEGRFGKHAQSTSIVQTVPLCPS
jgi:hypothetical protein